MAFFSLEFLFFFLVVFVFYYVIPQKYSYLWLLGASYFFYASWSLKYTFVLLVITIISFFVARLMRKWNKKLCLYCGVGLSIGVLYLFKFWKFWAEGLYILFGITDKSTGGIITIIAPVGISFYTLAAIGYMIDVYKGKIESESHITKYALFISFFPTVLSGPITRGGNFLKQIHAGAKFSYEKVKRGLLLIIWGYFLKLLIANRLAQIVDAVFASYTKQTGATLLIAMILYGVQLYADFSGYSYIAIGISHTLGFTITENFKQPYFAKDIKDFWGRWHISFSSWLKDYVYIPLGGNHCGKFRQYFNLFITFIVSGIWHGTGLQFLVWGGLHGIYQIISRACVPIKSRILDKLRIKRDCFSYHLFQSIITFGFVDLAWLFFRSESLYDALRYIKYILFNFQLGNTIFNKLYLAGYDVTRFYILLIEMLVLLLVDILHEKKVSLIGWLDLQNRAFRWMVYICILMVIVVGAIYDFGLEASTFIYTQF